MSESIVQLFTPGLDSFLAYYQLQQKYKKESIRRIYIDIKSRYSQYEIDFLKNLYSDEEIEIISNIDLSKIEKENAHVPNRNILLITLVQSITNCDVIYINGVKDDRVSDNTFDFRKSMSNLLSSVSEKDVQVKSILDNCEKSTLVEQYIQNGNNKLDLLEKTYSCYNKEFYIEENLSIFEQIKFNTRIPEFREIGKFNVHGCLECVACYRRMCALTFANIFVPFYNFKLSKEYYDSKISNVLYPNRVKSIKKYHEFLSWFGCD